MALKLNYYALLACICIENEKILDKIMRVLELFDAQNYPGEVQKA